MYKHVCYAIPGYVECVYNTCLRTRHFPLEWKGDSVIVLPKEPNKVRSNPSLYRPNLLDAFNKVLERILVMRLPEKVNLLQYAFHSGKASDEA